MKSPIDRRPFWANTLIIDRYLITEISKPLIVICAVLITIFASYSAARYLADAASGLLAGETVIFLILLKVIIALEVLLPTTLYLSVVMALGRLYKDSEIIALSACGVGRTRILRAVFYLALLVALLVACLSLFVRPWAYSKFYWVKAKAKIDFDISRMDAGKFYEIDEGNRIIFAQEVKQRRNLAKRVFIQREHGDSLQIIYARQVQQLRDGTSGHRVLVFREGFRYEFPRNGSGGHITAFDQTAISIPPREITPARDKIKASSTSHLGGSQAAEDIAELQWRYSTPLSTILLALLGVPLSRTTPRQGKYAKMVAAAVIYAVYYNINAVAKTWVAKGVVGALPGVWWVQALLAGLLLALILPSIFASRQHR